MDAFLNSLGMDNWPTPQSHPPPPQVQSQPPAPLQQLQTPPPIHAQAPHQSRMSSNVAAIAQPRQEDFPCPRYKIVYGKTVWKFIHLLIEIEKFGLREESEVAGFIVFSH